MDLCRWEQTARSATIPSVIARLSSAAGCPRAVKECPEYQTGGSRHIPHPAAKAAMCVDSVHPFVEEPALGSVLFAVPSLGFQYQHVTRLEPDEEVRTILPHHAAMDVEHLEAEVIVFRPGGHLRGVVEGKGFRGFLGAVIDAEIDVAARCARARPAGVPYPHIAG